jgi:hypothetical protein
MTDAHTASEKKHPGDSKPSKLWTTPSLTVVHLNEAKAGPDVGDKDHFVDGIGIFSS